MSFWNPQGYKGGGTPFPDPNSAPQSPAAPGSTPPPTFGSQPLGPSGNPFGFDNPNLYGSAYNGQNQPATWNGDSYSGPIDQSYQNIARGDQFTGTRDGFLWVAGNRIMPSYGDQARDRLELQTNFGVGGLSANTNPLIQGPGGQHQQPAAAAPEPFRPPESPNMSKDPAQVAPTAAGPSQPGYGAPAGPFMAPESGDMSKSFWQAPSAPQRQSASGSSSQNPVVSAMMRKYKRGQW